MRDDGWVGVIADSIVMIRQTESELFYKFYPPKSESDEQGILKDYFQLNHSLSSFYDTWGGQEHSLNKQFKYAASGLKGVRLLRQDPRECLFSFICSSNNNIGRITKMVEFLCSHGTLIGEIEGQKYYEFPTIAQLSTIAENTLREAGFGYRARFIVQTAKQLSEYTKEWLYNLRSSTREEAQKNLMTLMGVGQKVADCVCLFSLDKLDIVPVDTHIWSIAQKHMPSIKKSRTLTSKNYSDIADFFRERFGIFAGWAHTVLFAADLPQFKNTILSNKAEVEVEVGEESFTKPKRKRVK
jgi:N-glycosylase/DNA lyase